MPESSEVLEWLAAESSFEGKTFKGVDAQALDLTGKEFYGCTFSHMKAPQSRWTRAHLEDCVFDTCDLTRMLPAQVVLRGVKLEQCKLLGVDWSKLGSYPDVTYVECQLRYASFVDESLSKTRFERCAMQECTFLRVDLVQARFEACELSGARFDGCDLRGADFARSLDVYVDPTKNKVQGMRIPSGSVSLLAESFGMKVV